MFLIYTEDNFLLSKQTKKIIEKLKNNNNDVEINQYSWLENDANSIIQDAKTYSLFDNNKIIVIKDCYFLTEKKIDNKIKTNTSDKALELLKIQNPNVKLIFTLNEKTISKKLKVSKTFNSECETISIPELTDQQILEFVKKKIEMKNKKISEETAKYLISKLPLDMQIISNEVNKISNLNTQIINKNIIDENISKYNDVDIFKLAESYIADDHKNFILMIKDYLALNNDLISLLYLLGSNLSFTRDSFILKKQFKSEQEIADLLNAHPYRVKMIFKTYNNIDINTLNDKILLLYKLNNSLIKGEISSNTISELELLKVMKRG